MTRVVLVHGNPEAAVWWPLVDALGRDDIVALSPPGFGAPVPESFRAYVWHHQAQVWQTPGAGEEAFAAMVASRVADRAQRFEAIGMSPEAARKVADATDEAMGRCILALYRSAAQPYLMALGQRLARAAVRPGLVIAAAEDHFAGGVERARWAAGRAGARVTVLPGVGHWWMLQDPEAGPAALQGFWAGFG